MKAWLAISMSLFASSALAQSPMRHAPRLDFLVGQWEISGGRFVMIGGRPHGTSNVTREAAGAAYVIRDHSVLYGVEGQDMGTNDSIIFIYNSGDALRADYVDSSRTTHYTVKVISDGHEVSFIGDPLPSGTVEIVDYLSKDADTLEITHGIRKAGASDSATFLTEILTRN